MIKFNDTPNKNRPTKAYSVVLYIDAIQKIKDKQLNLSDYIRKLIDDYEEKNVHN